LAGTQALPRFKALLAQAEQVLDAVVGLGDAPPRLRQALPAWLNLTQLLGFERALRDSGLISGLETQLLPAQPEPARPESDAALVPLPAQPQPAALTWTASTARRASSPCRSCRRPSRWMCSAA